MTLLFALVALLRANNPWRIGATGLIIAVGFFVKQSAIIVFLPFIVIVMLINARKYWPLLLTAFLGIFIPWLVLDLGFNGLFSYYIFYLPSQHGYSILSAANFWVGDIFSPLGIASGFITFYVIYTISKIKRNRQDTELDNLSLEDWVEKSAIQILVFSLGALSASWITRATNGGGGNNSMAAYAAIALCFGLSYDKTVSYIDRKKLDANYKDIFVPALVLIQFIGLIYNPFKYLPTESDYSLNELLMDNISAEEQILIPYRSHFPAMLGKDPQIHIVNLFELTGYFKGDVLPEGRTIVNQIREGICAQKYGLIIIDRPIPWFEEQIAYSYERLVMDVGSARMNYGNQSQVTDWQKGYLNIYIPRTGSLPEDCNK